MTVQEQAKALGDPIRYRLFEYIAGAARPVTVAELTAAVDLRHNAVRRHLATLLAARLIEEGLEERHRAGRPRLLYTLAPGAAGRWDTDGPYRDLSLLLLDVLRTGEAPVDVGRRAGFEVSRGVSPPTGDDAPVPLPLRPDREVPAGVERIIGEMARRGFDPCLVDLGNGSSEVVLRACPFADAATDTPAVVCAIHEGIVKGIADAAGDVEVLGLARRGPHQAGCRMRLRHGVVGAS